MSARPSDPVAPALHCTNADRAAALRALERRALAAHDPLLALVIRARLDIVETWSALPRDPGHRVARREWIADGIDALGNVATASRETERNARERAETAEAALAVLREVAL